MQNIYKYKSIWTIFCVLFCATTISAQMSFTNSNHLLQSTDWHSGVAIGVVDMDGDGLDDILRLNDGRILTIEYQVQGGMFTPFTYDTISGQSQWTMAAADINNNGYNDVIAGDYNTTKIILSGADGASFSHSLLPGPDFFAQGSNFADINNDGLLDIFVCNDDAESRIWVNNGDDTFSEADYMIDMATTPPSDNSGNYGSIWTDFDNDGDLDLYIAKCRQGVQSSSDPRRINALFVNDGNNNYTEQAGDYGLKIGWQSWTADFNDFDNDGDLDAFITNHDFANMLMENDGFGHFKDISTGQDIGIESTSFPVQGVMRDFDNDGFMDILVAGDKHHLYHNNGDGTFTEILGLFDDNDIESYALGDLNHDGFVDIYAGYAHIYTTPSDIEDVIWLNDGNDNNWFGVNLQGVETNRNGIGARIEIYGDWGIQVREVRAGESYGIMNSLKQNFGLGEATSIDKVVVKWPSGIINVVDNPDINQYLNIIESECEPFSVDIAADGPTVICSGTTTVDLVAPAGYNYIWSTGETSQTITVGNAGNYNVVVENMTTGCYGLSQSIAVIVDPDETPTVEIDGDLEFCLGESVTLTSSVADAYTWSNDETTQSIEVTSSGTYAVTTQGTCDEFTSSSLEVFVYQSDVPLAEDVVLNTAGPATLTAEGSNPQWYDAEIGGNFLGEGLTLNLPLVEESTTYWVSDIDVFQEDLENTGMPVHQGNDYSGAAWNGGIIFNAFEDFTIDSVLVYTDTEAERLIELFNDNGDLIESLLINIPATGEEGINIGLDFDVPAGFNYVLTTDVEQNNLKLGTNTPRLKRADQGVNYLDYFIDDIVDITGASIGGSERYYYFFDWQVSVAPVSCETDRVPVEVSILVSTNDLNNSNEIRLFPNPSSGEVNLRLDFEQPTELDLHLMDLSGKVVYAENMGTINGLVSHNLDFKHLAKGIYIVQLVTPNDTYFGKISIK